MPGRCQCCLHCHGRAAAHGTSSACQSGSHSAAFRNKGWRRQQSASRSTALHRCRDSGSSGEIKLRAKRVFKKHKTTDAKKSVAIPGVARSQPGRKATPSARRGALAARRGALAPPLRAPLARRAWKRVATPAYSSMSRMSRVSVVAVGEEKGCEPRSCPPPGGCHGQGLRTPRRKATRGGWRLRRPPSAALRAGGVEKCCARVSVVVRNPKP